MSAAVLVLILAVAQEDDPARLVGELGADRPDARDRAERKLILLGERAREALGSGAKSADPEVKVRATALLRRLDLYLQLRPWYAPESRVTLGGRMTLQEAVLQVERQTGQKVSADAWPPEAFAIDLKEVPFWDALEAIGAASGRKSLSGDKLGPRFVGTRHVKAPSVTAGPFRLALRTITEDRRYFIDSATDDSTWMLELELKWEKSIDPVRTYGAVTRATDDAGADYVVGFEAYGERIIAGMYPGFLEDHHRTLGEVFLATNQVPPRQVRTLAELSGVATVYVRGSKGEIVLPLPAPGDSSTDRITVYDDRLEHLEEVTLSLSEVQREETRLTCKLDFKNADPRLLWDIFNYLYLTDGAGMKYQGIPQTYSDQDAWFTLTFDSVPAAAEPTGIAIRLPRILVRVEIPFTLRDIPVR
jgi:hypothetical protein